MLKIEEIVALEKIELVEAITRKRQVDIKRKEFIEDLNKVWKEYRVAKYGKLAFLFKYVMWNSLLFEVFFITSICNHPNYWFNQKWKIKSEGGKFDVYNREEMYWLRMY